MLHSLGKFINLFIMANIYILQCCFYGLLVTNIYKTSLVSHLTKPTFSKTINTLDELVESDLGWGIVNAGAGDYQLFASSDVGNVVLVNLRYVILWAGCGVYTNIWRIAVLHRWDFLHGESFKRRFCLHILENLPTGYHSKKFCWQVWEQNGLSGLVHVLPICLKSSFSKANGFFNTPANIAWAFQQDSPLKPKFDRIIRKLTEVSSTVQGLVPCLLLTYSAYLIEWELISKHISNSILWTKIVSLYLWTRLC